MTLCPHPGLLVGGRCYWCCKQAALNGHRDRLEPEALAFVGFRDVPEPEQAAPVRRPTGWTPAALRGTAIDKQLEELAALRDRAPGYFALLKRILEKEGDRS